MISIRDSITLARTKLRTKRVRQVVTVVVSALGFGAIIAVTVIMSGIDGSVKRFAHEQFGGNYYVSAQLSPADQPAYISDPSDSTVVKRIKELDVDFRAKRAAAAKRLGIAYDPNSETPAIITDKLPDGTTRTYANSSSVAYDLYLGEIRAQQATAKPLPTKEQLVALTAPYHARAIVETTGLAQGTYMPGGKEPMEPTSGNPRMPVLGQTTPLSDIQYAMVDQSLVESLMLPSNDRRAAVTDAIPVVMPVSTAVKAFGASLSLPEKPSNTHDALDWYKQVGERLNGTTYSVCYRNAASASLLQLAIAQAQKKSSETPHYSRPAADSCGPITVTYGSAAEKKAAEDQVALDRETMPSYQDPVQQKVRFVIAGISTKDDVQQGSMGLESFMSSFLGISNSSVLIPRQGYEQLSPEIRRLTTLLTQTYSTGSTQDYQMSMNNSWVVRFDTVADARSFIRAKNCIDEMGAYPGQCGADKPFYLFTYGSQYLALDDFTRFVQPIMVTAFIIVGAISGVIIMAMMSQVIANSRRETAVFRAIGAHRSDISKVYLLYALNITLRIAFAALIFGFTSGGILELLYAAQATDYARIAFGVVNSNAHFGFIGTNSFTWLVVGIIFVLGIVSTLPPLLRNVRRNPIHDMRDE